MTVTQFPNPQALYATVRSLIQTIPAKEVFGPTLSADAQLWIGRANAIIQQYGRISDQVEFQSAIANLAHYRDHSVQQLSLVLYKLLGAVELQLPVEAQGAFIPAGNTFDALAAAARIFKGAETDLLIVDPYMDETVLTDFAASAPANVTLRLMAAKESAKPSLAPAARRWIEQHGTIRPLTVKIAPARSLHDRLIAVDHRHVWIVTQSFNGIAKHSPASFAKVDNEAAALKLSAYEEMWDSAGAID